VLATKKRQWAYAACHFAAIDVHTPNQFVVINGQLLGLYLESKRLRDDVIIDINGHYALLKVDVRLLER